MSTQYEEPSQIRDKTQCADHKDEDWVADIGRIEKSLHSFDDDIDAKSDEEYGIEEGS
jgi:hypothetical protein